MRCPLGTTDTSGAGADVMMNRRTFLTMAAGGLLAAPLAADAQQAAGVHLIGYLAPGFPSTATDPSQIVVAFRARPCSAVVSTSSETLSARRPNTSLLRSATTSIGLFTPAVLTPLALLTRPSSARG